MTLLFGVYSGTQDTGGCILTYTFSIFTAERSEHCRVSHRQSYVSGSDVHHFCIIFIGQTKSQGHAQLQEGRKGLVPGGGK